MHNGGSLFFAEVRIWIGRELSTAESLEFAGLHADVLLIVDGGVATVTVVLYHSLLHPGRLSISVY